MRPPDDDRLTEARAADALNRILDGAGTSETAGLGDPKLHAAVRRINAIAASNVPAQIVRADEDRLWEDLMQRHTTAAPTAGPVSVPADAVTRQDDLRWRPRFDRPAERSGRIGHRIGHRVMGMAATLTIVALIGLSGLAVYLNFPDGGGEPTSMPALSIASPSVDEGSFTLADSVPRALPMEWYTDVPPVETYGDGWSTFGFPRYALVPGTTSQVNAYPFVNDFGSRIEIRLVHYANEQQGEAVFDWFTGWIKGMQQQLQAEQRPDLNSSSNPGDLAEVCSAVVRAAGSETITGFPVQATVCLVPERSLVVSVVFNGHPMRLPYALPEDAPIRSDVIVKAVLNYQLTRGDAGSHPVSDAVR